MTACDGTGRESLVVWYTRCLVLMFGSFTQGREPSTSKGPAPTFARVPLKRSSLWPGIVVVSREKSLIGPMPRSGSSSAVLPLATTQVCAAGLGSAFPAPFWARTSNVCFPSTSPWYTCGLVHEPNGPESSLHSYVSFAAAVTVSLPPNSKRADLLF